MTRPAFLVVDPEYPGSISARKLVIETAKMNVITAYSGPEAVETLRRFPGVDAVVLNAQLPDCVAIARELKAVNAKVPLVVISPNAGEACGHGDHRLSSYDPQALLEFLKRLLGE